MLALFWFVLVVDFTVRLALPDAFSTCAAEPRPLLALSWAWILLETPSKWLISVWVTVPSRVWIAPMSATASGICASTRVQDRNPFPRQEKHPSRSVFGHSHSPASFRHCFTVMSFTALPAGRSPVGFCTVRTPRSRRKWTPRRGVRTCICSPHWRFRSL